MYKMLLSHIGLGHNMPDMKKASLKGKREIAERTYDFVFKKPQGFLFNADQHA